MFKAIKNGTDSVRELLTIYLVSVALVATLFMFIEGHNYLDSLWWTFVTGLTIGYGDIYPVTVAGKVLAVIWANFAILFLVPMFVGRVIVNMIDNKNEFTDKEQKTMLTLLKGISDKVKK